MNEELPLYKKRIVYKIPGMDTVDVRRDIVYKKVDGSHLKMDIYVPAELSGEAALPGIVFVPGGPLRTDKKPSLKDWGVYVSYGQLAAASGFIGVTLDHSYHHYSNLVDANSNVITAIDTVRERADESNLDPDRLCLWTFSGGGPFLAFAFRDRPKYVRCIVIYYALLDLRAIKQFSEVGDEFSPVLHISSRNKVPIFLVRSGLDRPYVNQAIDQFVQEMLAANMPFEFVNYTQGRHAFDILDDNARSRQIIERTLEFVKTNL